MAERPRNLVVGTAILAVLAALALIAPFVATDQPLVAKSHGRLASPAFATALGRGPQSWDRVILPAPVPHAPNRIHLDEVLQGPSGRHWLGTDALGRDLTARVIHGARVSLAVGILAALFAVVLGVPLGAAAGYLGGWTDAVISRLVEAVLCFPAILLVLVLLATDPLFPIRWSYSWLLLAVSVCCPAYAGLMARLLDLPLATMNLPTVRIAFVIGITGWVAVARYLRGEFLKLRDSDMVSAARAMGAGHLRIAVRHILPCSLAPVLVTASFAVAAAIMLEAALSFLGLGVPPPAATWGGLLFEAREQVHRAWWLALFPGVALFLAVLSCNLIGEGIRDALDPRRQKSARGS